MKIYMNWSGGKDCCLALASLIEAGKVPQLLLTTVSAATGRVSMHGVSHGLMRQQAEQLNIPLMAVSLPEEGGIDAYNAAMQHAMNELKQQGFTHAAFGDIFLEDLRAFRDSKLEGTGIGTVYPLWKKDTKELALAFIRQGFKAIVVCVSNDVLDGSFCGRTFDEHFLADLPATVDPCGENGEFHTFVYDGPVFKEAVRLETGEKVFRTYPPPVEGRKDAGFWFLDLYSRS